MGAVFVSSLFTKLFRVQLKSEMTKSHHGIHSWETVMVKPWSRPKQDAPSQPTRRKFAAVLRMVSAPVGEHHSRSIPCTSVGRLWVLRVYKFLPYLQKTTTYRMVSWRLHDGVQLQDCNCPTEWRPSDVTECNAEGAWQTSIGPPAGLLSQKITRVG